MKKNLKVTLILGIMLCLTLAATSVGAISAGFTDIKLFLNGNQIKKQVLVVDGTSYLPLRAISETLGLQVDWNGQKREINLTGNTGGNVPMDLINKKDLVGEWQGNYSASQGLTKLKLTITDEGNQLSAKFDFGPTKNNPSVPFGSYTMKVDFDEDSKAVQLTGDKWINRPNSYDFVNLIGSVSGQYINGAVISEDEVYSGTFSVKKID